jgi:HTH-type transcriptional regulator, competence development regulator
LQQALHRDTFGARLRRKRHEGGFSQRELASRVGVDFTYLSKLENDQEGQSPGEDLVRKLAGALGDDAEELLALAGKVPVGALRTRARADAPFAWFLRRLSEVPGDQISRWTDEVAVAADPKGHPPAEYRRERLREILEPATGADLGNLPELLEPLIERGGIRDAHIVARLVRPKRAQGAPEMLACSYSINFEATQDECLLGVVTSQTHLHRLREIGAPLDEILVIDYDATLEQPAVDDIVRTHSISVRHCDEGEGAYSIATLERLPDPSWIWGKSAESPFPVIVLRAAFPQLAPDRKRRIELSYTLPVPIENGFWFWTAARPTYVTAITVHAEDLVRDRDLYYRFMPSLPSIVEETEAGGVYSVRVDGWALTGHGVTLTWSPRGAPASTG